MTNLSFWATLDAIPRINSFVVDDYVQLVSTYGLFNVPPIGIFYELDRDVIAAMGLEIHKSFLCWKTFGFLGYLRYHCD